MDSSPFSTQPRESPTPPQPVTPPRPNPPRRSGLSPRLLTAAVGIPLVLLFVWIGGGAFRLLCLVLACGALRELQVAVKRSDQLRDTQILGVIAYPAILWAVLRGVAPQWPFILLTVLLTLAVLLYGRGPRISLPSLAMTLMATLYIGLFALLPTLRAAGHGELFYLTLFTVWASDTAAYYGGRALGRTPFSPLSPGKTQEGFLCGVLGALLVAAFMGALTGFGAPQGILMGAVIAAAAPLGDLAESFWKRELGVKDLGTIFPGHGGILDRCDSILFAALGVWLYITLLMGAVSRAEAFMNPPQPTPLTWSQKLRPPLEVQ